MFGKRLLSNFVQPTIADIALDLTIPCICHFALQSFDKHKHLIFRKPPDRVLKHGYRLHGGNLASGDCEIKRGLSWRKAAFIHSTGLPPTASISRCSSAVVVKEGGLSVRLLCLV